MTTSITIIPCKDLYEERAAITEFDGQLSRYLAELTAAKAQGFDNSIAISSAFILDDKGNCNCPLCHREVV